MDICINHMDHFFMHLAPLLRRYPSEMPVQSIGYYRSKKEYVNQTFQTLNFSLLLRGAGTYKWQDRQYTVQAPCVITQWPDIAMHYGPHPGTTWEELFIIYSPHARNAFENRKLLSPQQPFWSINREADVRESCAALSELLHQPPREGFVDRLDRLCELLLLDTHLGKQTQSPASRTDNAIDAIRKHVQENLFQAHDFDQLARNHGLSASTFRRCWNRRVQHPPARYVAQLRIRAACRMLVETDLTINEIAHETGFDDAFYFSRCFRSIMGPPPAATASAIWRHGYNFRLDNSQRGP